MSGKLRAAILRTWQGAAASIDEPDNAHLARWVDSIVIAEQAARRRAKDDFQRMDRLRQEVANAYRLPTPQSLVSEAAVRHLVTARDLLADGLNHVGEAVDRVEAARKLILGEPVEPCPGGCGIDLGHPGNPDRRCACLKRAEPESETARVWPKLDEVDELPFIVEVKPATGFITVWTREPMSRDFEHDGRSMRIEQLRYLGEVREVRS